MKNWTKTYILSKRRARTLSLIFQQSLVWSPNISYWENCPDLPEKKPTIFISVDIKYVNLKQSQVIVSHKIEVNHKIKFISCKVRWIKHCFLNVLP
jgi:hypothetical protein